MKIGEEPDSGRVSSPRPGRPVGGEGWDRVGITGSRTRVRGGSVTSVLRTRDQRKASGDGITSRLTVAIGGEDLAIKGPIETRIKDGALVSNKDV